MKTKLVLTNVEFFDMQACEEFLNMNAEQGWHPVRITHKYVIFEYDEVMDKRYVLIVDPSQKLSAYGRDELEAKQQKLDDMLAEFDYEVVGDIYNIVIYSRPSAVPHITDEDLERTLTKKERWKQVRSHIFRNYNSTVIYWSLFILMNRPLILLGYAMFSNSFFIICLAIFISVYMDIGFALLQIVKAIQYGQGNPVFKPRWFKSITTSNLSRLLWFTRGSMPLLFACLLIALNPSITYLLISLLLIGLSLEALLRPYIVYAWMNSKSLIKRLQIVLPHALLVLSIPLLVYVPKTLGLIDDGLTVQNTLTHFTFPTLQAIVEEESCKIHEGDSWFYKSAFLGCDNSFMIILESKSEHFMPIMERAAKQLSFIRNIDTFNEDDITVGRVFNYEYLKSGSIILWSSGNIPDALVDEVVGRDR